MLREEIGITRASAAPVCVLGMHRSGTSVVTQLLGALGLDLGSEDDLLDPDAYNPQGYWELGQVVRLNDRLLHRLGGAWDRPPHPPSGWEKAPDLEDLRREAGDLVERFRARNTRWGFKDPRTCLTLPFWLTVLPEPRFVVCVRDPSSVSASLVRRDGMESADALQLWLRYTSAALEYSTGFARILLSYDDLITDPVSQTRRVAGFLGVPETAAQAAAARIADVVSPTLRHHSAFRPFSNPEQPPSILVLQELIRIALKNDNDDLLRLFAPLLPSLGAMKGDRVSATVRATERTEHVRQLEDVRAKLAEAGAERAHAQREAWRRGEALQEAHNQLRALEPRLATVERLSRLLHIVERVLLPAGSWRRRIASWGWRKVRRVRRLLNPPRENRGGPPLAEIVSIDRPRRAIDLTRLDGPGGAMVMIAHPFGGGIEHHLRDQCSRLEERRPVSGPPADGDQGITPGAARRSGDAPHRL